MVGYLELDRFPITVEKRRFKKSGLRRGKLRRSGAFMFCVNLILLPRRSVITLEMRISCRLGRDLISQAELRKGAELMTGASSAVQLVRELYLNALERRLGEGAGIEQGPLSFMQGVGVVPQRKSARKETETGVVELLRRSI